MMMNKMVFLQFSDLTVAVYFMSIIIYISTHRAGSVSYDICVKPLHLLRPMGMSVPSLHIESTDSIICTCHFDSELY